ncbi:hypothetical protein KIH41_16285 [Litoribacter ruber]|uniref:Uncharacterized protein n=1 Tax=Litoribacter ruber TaxID=702568 RepID=A0AAP2CNC7_9BACT|nr:MULTISPECIES: hypothetical protein [Litoribacter]MBS9525705.1 hypothetical protein [Litoribacter alkaliphilus]MBT0812846.1 hypothetical protein [Litoribacter ruber]
MDGLNMSMMIGGVVTLLLSTLSYFLHLMILDIRLMRVEQRELRDLCIVLKTEQQIIKEWLADDRLKMTERIRHPPS